MKKLITALVLSLALGASLAQANPLISETSSLSERVPGFYEALSKAGPKALSFTSRSFLEDLNRTRYLKNISLLIASVKIVGYESVAIETTGRAERPLGIARVRIEVMTRGGVCHALIHETEWVWEQRNPTAKPAWYFIGHDSEEKIAGGCKQK